jgi:SAM-dependent methyltransferase
VPTVHIICAAFPCAGLTGPFDLATCAAAFHWLDEAPALYAVRQLLRPGGIWAMWWNSYLDETEDHPFGRQAMALLRSHAVQFPPSFGTSIHRALDASQQTALLERNGFHDIESRQWRVRRSLDTRGARELFESFSFVRILSEAQRLRLLEEIEAIVADRFHGQAENWVSTACYSARPA